MLKNTKDVGINDLQFPLGHVHAYVLKTITEQHGSGWLEKTFRVQGIQLSRRTGRLLNINDSALRGQWSLFTPTLHDLIRRRSGDRGTS